MAAELKSVLDFYEVETRLALAAIQGPGVRIVTTNLPQDVEDVDEWIAEHGETLLGLPGTASSVLCRYEILRSTDGHDQLELTYVKRSKIEWCAQTLRGAGIQLMSLTAGPRALAQTFPYLDREIQSTGTSLLSLGDHALTKLELREAIRLPIRVFPFDTESASSLTCEELGISPGTTVVVAGENTQRIEIQDTIQARPFGLEPIYALASGLALEAFARKPEQLEFLSEAEQIPASEVLCQKAEKRSALALGGALLVLLLFQFALSTYVRSEIAQLEDLKGTLSNRYAEVEALAQRVVMLDHEFGARYTARWGEPVARLLHDAAAASPESLWFSKIDIFEDKSRIHRITIQGYSTSTANVASLIRRLDSGPFRNTRLIRSAFSTGTSLAHFIRRLPRDYVVFEVTSEGSAR
jgi:Tfp pilus assembly protein PilN